MVLCAAVGCNNDSRWTKGVGYYAFSARKPEIQKIWLQKIRRKDYVVTKNSRLCGIHFESDMFERDLFSELTGNVPRVKLLKDDAIPTLFDFERAKSSGVKRSAEQPQRPQTEQKIAKKIQTEEDVEYYVTKMHDSGARVELKSITSVPCGFKRNMGLPDGNIIEVTCGHLEGYLHRDRFYCPGIHRECIEVDGEFVSPKKFSVLGDKHRLKDWKNAIRINNRQIRKYIESGELTFWNHDSLCTGRCVARAPAIRPGMPNLSENKDFRFETLTTSSISPAPDMPSQVSLMVPEDVSGAKGDDGDWDTSNDIKPDVKELQAQMLAATKLQTVLTSPHTTVSDMSSKTTSYTYPVCSPSVSSGHNLSEESSDEDDRMLWKGIVELGLADEFFREIKAALDVFKNDMIRRYVPPDASKKISVIVKELGLMTKLRYKLGAHKSDMDKQRQKLDREMEDLQRRVKEYELKKAMLKRKSECFDQLIEISTLKKEQGVDEQTMTPIEYLKANEDCPRPVILLPNQIMMQSSANSVAINVADSNSVAKNVMKDKIVYVKHTDNLDDQNDATDCESSEQISNVDTESNHESTFDKGDNCAEDQEEEEGNVSSNGDKVDSTTNNDISANLENNSSSSGELDDPNNLNTSDNATEENNKNEEFTGIRVSKRRRIQKSFEY